MQHLFLITRVPSRFLELVAFLSLVAVFFVGAWVLLIAPNARARDALPTAAQPHGWSYPLCCCSGYDCREVAYNAVAQRLELRAVAGGWRKFRSVS